MLTNETKFGMNLRVVYNFHLVSFVETHVPAFRSLVCVKCDHNLTADRPYPGSGVVGTGIRGGRETPTGNLENRSEGGKKGVNITIVFWVTLILMA